MLGKIREDEGGIIVRGKRDTARGHVPFSEVRYTTLQIRFLRLCLLIFVLRRFLRHPMVILVLVWVDQLVTAGEWQEIVCY